MAVTSAAARRAQVMDKPIGTVIAKEGTRPMQTAIASTGLRVFAACALAFLAMTALAMTAATGTSNAAAEPEAVAGTSSDQIRLPALL